MNFYRCSIIGNQEQYIYTSHHTFQQEYMYDCTHINYVYMINVRWKSELIFMNHYIIYHTIHVKLQIIQKFCLIKNILVIIKYSYEKYQMYNSFCLKYWGGGERIPSPLNKIFGGAIAPPAPPGSPPMALTDL